MLSQQEISDRIEIDDLITRTAVATDSWDFELLKTCYTPESVVDYTNVGGPRDKLAGILEWLEWSMKPGVLMERRVTNRYIHLDGDTATGRSYMMKVMKTIDRDRGGDPGSSVWVGCFYDDKFARTPDGWRIMERIEVVSWYDGTWPEGWPVVFCPLPWDRAGVTS
jgi:hypothetical protein